MNSIRAVLFDFGGVITSSPFEAFARYESERGLPSGFLRSVNARDHHTNAWARLERSELTPDQFDAAFADESAALGHRVPGADVLALLVGVPRPRMLAALGALRTAGFSLGCLTNNVLVDDTGPFATIAAAFDAVVESSRVGVRKPEPRFYEIACERLAVEPAHCVFLDDLGVNLKPARDMGMTTIKVVDADEALDRLSAIVGVAL